MDRTIVGNIKFTKPIVEKVIDIYYVVEENDKEVVKHTYTILTYEEMDKTAEDVLEERKIKEKNPKLIVIDETVSVNFGDEEIEKHYDSIIFYDKEWIETKNPDRKDFHKWLVEFVDKILYPIKKG